MGRMSVLHSFDSPQCRRVACRANRYALWVLRNHFRRIAKGRSKEARNARLLLGVYGTPEDRREYAGGYRTQPLAQGKRR